MSGFKMLVDGGSFYRGKRKCDVALDSSDGMAEAKTAIWSAVGLLDEYTTDGGQIEVCMDCFFGYSQVFLAWYSRILYDGSAGCLP
jgi:hypothetical protein